MHWPEALTPWDATFYEYAIACLSQYNTRHYLIPPALGIDYRVLNGYAYLTPVPVMDPAEIEARVPHFMERAGFYFMNWNDLYDKWLVKIKALAAEMEAITFDPLPEKEDIEVITEGRGTGSGLTIQEDYRKLLNLGLRLWQYHFEFLNLGYAAYLDFFGFCKEAFPNIPDLAIAKMVAGVEVDLFKPDEYLKELSQAAIDAGVAEAFDHDDRRRRRRRHRSCATAAPSGMRKLGRGQGPVVQLLGRVRLLPLRQDLGRAPGDPVRVHPQLHRQDPRGSRPRTADGGHPRRARSHHRRVPGPARIRRGPGGLRRQARPCQASCSRTSRTTTSTSSTGATRSCGARCASSARCSSRRASSPTATTSSTSSATR